MSPLIALCAIQTGDPYVRLGSALGEEFTRYETYLGYAIQRSQSGDDAPERPPIPSGVQPDATPLAVRRAEVQRFGLVVNAFMQVSANGYRLPSTPFAGEELGSIKALARLVVAAARVKFADGDRNGAVTLLLDGLTMSNRIRPASTISLLVGCATQAIMLGEISDNLMAIPLADCDRIRTTMDNLYATPTAIPSDAPPGLRQRWGAGLKAWATAAGQEPEVPILHALAKDGLQRMLLRLHMRIEAYRWRQLGLPDVLTKAAPATEVDDPVAGLPFHYVGEAGGYRLWSEGLPEIGPIELRYRRAADSGESAPPIHP